MPAEGDVSSRVRFLRRLRGWSRETLASRAGVSFAAIAQIEAGRRRELRLSTVGALADAFGVSVDYLIGRRAPAPMLSHRALRYSSDDVFVDVLTPFLREGVERDEAVLVIGPTRKVDLLRDALDAHADGFDTRDTSEWYTTPRDTLARVRAYVADRLDVGRPWVRIVGEPLYGDHGPGENPAWVRYETLLNLSFAASPVSMVCPYDERELPPDLLASSAETHPQVVEAGAFVDSASFRNPESTLLEDPAVG